MERGLDLLFFKYNGLTQRTEHTTISTVDTIMVQHISVSLRQYTTAITLEITLFITNTNNVTLGHLIGLLNSD